MNFLRLLAVSWLLLLVAPRSCWAQASCPSRAMRSAGGRFFLDLRAQGERLLSAGRYQEARTSLGAAYAYQPVPALRASLVSVYQGLNLEGEARLLRAGSAQERGLLALQHLGHGKRGGDPWLAYQTAYVLGQGQVAGDAALYQLARIYHSQGHYAAAALLYERSLSENPESDVVPDARRRLQEVCILLNERQPPSRRRWFWGALGIGAATVTVVGVGVGLGLGLGLRQDASPVPTWPESVPPHR